jgi:serine/threonine-protein kinase
MDSQRIEWPFRAGDDIENRYSILRPLARGGVGAVYEAVHKWSDLHVALKVLFKREGDYAERMQAEARTLAKISHPNVVPITDGGVTTKLSPSSGVVWIAMQLLQGRNLREELIERGGFELSRALRFGIQIADGCAAAHALGVVHRDLKPENVFVVQAEDTVRILDFGVSKIRNELRPVALKTTDRFRLLGTQAYMAPEALQVGMSDARSDVYAAGHILYEMLAGRHCFSEGPGPLDFPPQMQLGLRQIFSPPLPVSQLAPHVPSYIEDVVMRALDKDPEARQQSMAALSADLGKALSRLEASRSPVRQEATAQLAQVRPQPASTSIALHASGPVAIGSVESRVSLDAATVCGAARFAAASPELTNVERGLRILAAVEAHDARFRGLLSDLASIMPGARQTALASYRDAFSVVGQPHGARVGAVLHLIRRTAIDGGWKPDGERAIDADRLDMLRGAALLIEPDRLAEASHSALVRMANLDEDTKSFAYSVLVAFARTPVDRHPGPRGALLALALGGAEDSELARSELAKFVLGAAGARDLGVEAQSIDLSDDPGAEQAMPEPDAPAPDDQATEDELAPSRLPPLLAVRFDYRMAFLIGLTAAMAVAVAGQLVHRITDRQPDSPPTSQLPTTQPDSPRASSAPVARPVVPPERPHPAISAATLPGAPTTPPSSRPGP